MNSVMNLIRSKFAITGLGLLLCIVVCMVMFTDSAFATEKDALTFSFNQETIKAGETIIGTLDANYDDITNGMLTITYDGEKLELVRAEKSNGQAEDTYVSINKETSGKVIVAFSSMNPVKKGALIDLEFKVDENVKNGTTLILNGGTPEIYDSNNKEIKETDLEKSFEIESENNETPSEPGSNSGQDGMDNEQDSATEAGQNPEDNEVTQAKTGDTSSVGLYVGIAAVALSVMAIVIMRRGGRRNDENE